MHRRLGELAELVGGEVRGDPERAVRGLRSLAAAGPEDLSFLTSARYREDARRSRAGALLVGHGVELPGRDLLVVADPPAALALLLGEFHPAARPPAGIHPTAIVAAGAEVAPSAHLGPYAVVGEGSRIGEGAVLSAHAVVGRGCTVGARSVLHPHAVLYDGTELGAECIVHAGAVLGSDGFGFVLQAGEHAKIPQVGRVVVEDRVEIGANTTIDRATVEETRVGAGSKLDNLVQVGHNVRLGRGCILVAQSGIAGSTELGDYVVLAGQAGVAGHLRVGRGARVAAKSAVFKDVEEGRQMAGIPAVEAARWRRQQAALQRLEQVLKRLRALERGSARGEGEEEET